MDLLTLAPAWAALILTGLLVLAAVQDIVQLKISNWLCAAVMVLAVIVAAIVGPTWSLWQNLSAFVVVLAIGTWLFGIGVFGGGDVKLLAAIVLWFDLAGTFRLMIAIALFGGLLALLVGAVRKIPFGPRARGGLVILQPKGAIPYGVAIAAGAIVTAAMLNGSMPPT